MKRPQFKGNKITSRYSDPTSMVLRNYIDISAQRLSKVRAGSHLSVVLKSETPQFIRTFQAIDDFPRPDGYQEGSPSNFIPSHRSEKVGGQKQMPVSEFMGTYLTQKNIDEDLLSKKEMYRYEFFKEKFGLMGKYLGEDILKEGLQKRVSSSEGHHHPVLDKTKKSKIVDHEAKDQIYASAPNEEKLGAEDDEGQAAKIANINREVMGRILKEEHEREMEALTQLQTEQNMQFFNDLEDFGFRGNDKKVASVGQIKTGASKLILKNNFLRNIATAGAPVTQGSTPQNNGERSEKMYSTGKRFIKKKTLNANANRPHSEYLVFRTHQKKENILPDYQKISNRIQSHKFGAKQTPGEFRTTNLEILNDYGSAPTSNKNIDNRRTPQSISMSKPQTPQQVGETIARQKRESLDFRNNKDILIAPKAIGSMINEEIEFLAQQRNLERIRATTAAERIRTPIITESKLLFGRGNSQGVVEPQKEAVSTSCRNIQVTEVSGQAETKEPRKSITTSKSQSKLVILPEEEKPEPQLKPQVLEPIKKKSILAHISPKVDNSLVKIPTQAPISKTELVFKKEDKVPYSTSLSLKTSQESIIDKPVSQAPKIKSAKKEERSLPSNQLFFTSSQFPPTTISTRTNSKGFVFDDRSASNSTGSLLTKNNFGNKYWINTFKN